jgi:hypothetical protein
MEYDTVICIPYRDRQKHLEGYLTNVIPLLQAHFPGVHVAIIEQAGTKHFNRGVLMNIGCHLFKDKTTYIMTNDVDTHPLEQTVRNIYTKAVNSSDVLGIYTAACGTLGGVIKMRTETMLKTNGFPNNYWGYGVEDKALQNRVEFVGFRKLTTILTNDPRIPEFFNVDNDHERVEAPNTREQRTYTDFYLWPRMTQAEKQGHVNQSGFNTLTYTVLERTQLNDITEKIFVDIDSVQ